MRYSKQKKISAKISVYCWNNIENSSSEYSFECLLSLKFDDSNKLHNSLNIEHKIKVPYSRIIAHPT
jgi:hypothetical protein